jgi:hypothetical protein
MIRRGNRRCVPFAAPRSLRSEWVPQPSARKSHRFDSMMMDIPQRRPPASVAMVSIATDRLASRPAHRSITHPT